jgi:fructose-bisphosphate aldolase class II
MDGELNQKLSRGLRQPQLGLECLAKLIEADSSFRLEKIRAATKGRAQLVLHGTNTFPDKTMQNCIKGGMTRCNVNELVLHTYSKYVAENTGKVPLTELMAKGTDLIQELVEYQMDVMGSTGKGDILY